MSEKPAGHKTIYGSSEADQPWPVGTKRRPTDLADPAMAGAAAEQMAALVKQSQTNESTL